MLKNPFDEDLSHDSCFSENPITLFMRLSGYEEDFLSGLSIHKIYLKGVIFRANGVYSQNED